MFRVEKHVYEARLSRMKQMIEAGVPPVVIYTEAKYLIAAWHPPVLDRVKGWLLGLWK